MRTGFAQELTRLADDDPNIWLLTGDLGFSVLECFSDRHPERFVNVGVAEQNMIGVAAGMAQSGKTIFAYSIATFLTMRCLEQIRNDICYPNLPVTFVGVGGGFSYSTQGFSHHAIEDVGLMRMLPNMTVAVPCDGMQAVLLTRHATVRRQPMYLRLEKAGEPQLHPEGNPLPFGKIVSLREGEDILLLCFGSITGNALAAAEKISAAGASVAVWTVPFVKPVDTESIAAAVRKFRAIVTVEEHQRCGGLGSVVAEILSAQQRGSAKLLRLGVDGDFIRQALSQVSAREHFGISTDQIAAQALRFWSALDEER
jgi:transketolase